MTKTDNNDLTEFTVVTDEMFRVTRAIRARTHLEAAIKAVHGCEAGQEVIVDQEGIGFVEGIPIGVYMDTNDDTEAEVYEFDVNDITSGNYPGDDDDED